MTWTPLASVFVAGEPKGQPRARAFTRVFGGKPTARMYDPGTAEGWKGAVALAMREHLPAEPIDGPVCVDIDFLFPRPKRLMRRCDPAGEIPHLAKPDRDNCDKAVLDCLKTLGLFRDDCQVCDGRPRKFYHAKTGRPGARITISIPTPDEPSMSPADFDAELHDRQTAKRDGSPNLFARMKV